MALDTGTARTSRTWRRGATTAAAVVGTLVAFVSFGAAPAGAVHDLGVFQLDGNALTALNPPPTANDDWDRVCHQVTITADPTGAIPDQCASATDTTGASAVAYASEPDRSTSIFTGGGSKDPENISSWAWKNAGGLPDKDNLRDAFAARYRTGTHDVLYFGSDRFDNSGDAQQGFWFLQNPVTLGGGPNGGGTGFTGLHKAGDLLILSDFSNGGDVSTIRVYKWVDSGGDTTTNLTFLGDFSNRCGAALTNDAACGIVNPANGTVAPWTFADKSGNTTYLNGEFFEAGIDLSSPQINLGGECFATVVAETRSSTSPTATLKDFVVSSFGKCTSELVTTPKDASGGTIPDLSDPADGVPDLSIGSGSVSGKDAAALTVTGAAVWTGNLDFYLCGPIATGTCTAPSGTKIGATIPVSNSTAQPILSAAAQVTSVGRYCWRGEFTSATSGVPNAKDDSAGECFTVVPVRPTLATTAGPAVDIGQAISDTATLTGTASRPGSPVVQGPLGAPAGGTITFTAYGPDNCTTVAFTSSAVTVSGDGTYGPVSFTPTAVGTYHWVASYSGDAPNTLATDHNTTCTDSAEDVVVRPVPSTTTTRQSVFPQDKAKIAASAGGNLAGSVSFRLYDTLANCQANSGTAAGGLLYSELGSAHPISGASPQYAATNNTSVRVTADTTVYWNVAYDSTNPAQNSSASTCVESTAVTYAGNDGSIPIP